MEWISQNAEIIGLVFDVFSLIVSIVLTCFVFFFETKRNVEIEQIENKRHETEINNKAQSFLTEFEDEQDYLILSYCARELQLKRNHHRKITTRFLTLEPEVQQAVLNMVNISNIKCNVDEIHHVLECFRKKFNQLDIGNDFLYDGSKYFHRAFSRYSNHVIDNVNPYIFTSILAEIRKTKGISNIFFNRDSNDTFYGYLCEYFRVDESGLKKADFRKPIEELEMVTNLRTCSEDIMTFWIMRMIVDVCHYIDSSSFDLFDENLIETNEDMYYYTLITLFATDFALEEVC